MLRPLIGRLASSSSWSSSSPGRPSPTTATRCSAFEVEHSMSACGYALVEDGPPGPLRPRGREAARRRRRGRTSRALQRGEEVEGASGPVTPEQVMGRGATGPDRRDHRRHRALPADRRGRRPSRAADPRRQLRRGGGPARRRNRPLDRRPGGRGGPRGAREDARPRPHLLPLPRRQGAGGGPGGLRPTASPRATST